MRSGVLVCVLMAFRGSRSSYPDHKEGEDHDETEELPSEKTLDYDDETMELILPSGKCTCPEYVASRHWDYRRSVFPSLPFHAVGREPTTSSVCLCSLDKVTSEGSPIALI